MPILSGNLFLAAAFSTQEAIGVGLFAQVEAICAAGFCAAKGVVRWNGGAVAAHPLIELMAPNPSCNGDVRTDQAQDG